MTPAYVSGVRSACERFRLFMAEKHPEAVRLYEVTAGDAAAFIEKLRATCAPKTVRTYCGSVRGAFTRFLPPGHVNPFSGVTGRTGGEKNGGSVHRVPFTAAELSAVLAAAREYQGGLLYGPVVVSACTALRRGDACRLDWRSVDLTDGAVTVKTSKTGETVDLPLLAPLRNVLESIEGPREGPCFPTAARMLAESPDALTWRFKAIVAQALQSRPEGEPPPDQEALAAAGMAAIERLPPGIRRERMAEAFRRHLAGENGPAIARQMGVSKGSVSGWLAAVSGMIGMPVVRGTGVSVRAEIARHTQVAREHGQRAASIRDWHALRTTFVTLALSAGVPIELVRKVTGHRTVEIVLSNYFRPGRETLRAALTDAMPAVLTGVGQVGSGQSAAGVAEADELVELAQRLAAGTATQEERRRVRQLAARV